MNRAQKVHMINACVSGLVYLAVLSIPEVAWTWDAIIRMAVLTLLLGQVVGNLLTFLGDRKGEK